MIGAVVFKKTWRIHELLRWLENYVIYEMFSLRVVVGLLKAVIAVANNNSFFNYWVLTVLRSLGPAVTNVHLVPDLIIYECGALMEYWLAGEYRSAQWTSAPPSPHSLFLHHTFHMDNLAIETRPTRWETGDHSPQPQSKVTTSRRFRPSFK